MKKKIIIFETVYVLLQYLLLNKDTETIYLTTDIFDKAIFEKLPGEKIMILRPKKSKFKLINKLKNFFWMYKLLKNDEIKKLKKNRELIVYGQDHIFIGNIFLDHSFYLLEDGIGNYCLPKKRTCKFLILKILYGIREMRGQSKNVKKIYLTGLASVPEKILKKVEIINLKDLWCKKSEAEKIDILRIFNFNKTIISSLKDKRYILFTQPFSEDGIISEEEKIFLYSEIIKKYDKKFLVIKRHPREETNYNYFFKDIFILDNNFPAEIFNLVDVKFEKAITISSMAAFGLSDAKKIDFYGHEINNKLFKKFINTNVIIKRNCYI
jgi:hypothetical protein